MKDVREGGHDETKESPSSKLPALTTPDRSPACRALIVHPDFKNRHPIYRLLTKQLQTWRCIQITGFSIPFAIHQNFVESQEDLGSVVWSGGIAVAAYMRQYAQRELQRKPWGSTTCLELGCGAAALVSQCAALVGIKSVMTDLPQVVEWARQNVEHNFSNQWRGNPYLAESIQKSEQDSVSPLITARTLCWGEASDLPSEDFDIVVAADCLYATRDDPDLQQKLLFTLKGLLANGRTKLLVSFQNRNGREATFVHETLPAVLTDYVVEEIHDRDDNINNAMLWVLPKSAASAFLDKK
jgi:predicted nicotinamide N-methyase